MNAPPFELCGVGFLVIGFMLIFAVTFGAIIVFVVKEGIKKLKEIKS